MTRQYMPCRREMGDKGWALLPAKRFARFMRWALRRSRRQEDDPVPLVVANHGSEDWRRLITK